MIDYFRGPYGINLLYRWHGSALAKAFIPGLLAVVIYLSIHYIIRYRHDIPEEYLDHPYAIGVLVSSVSFLIVFRANYGYQRYWEACGAVHQFMSKTMDASMHTAVFHLQSSKYDGIKPPTYFEYDDLNGMGLTRDRERMPTVPTRGEKVTTTAMTTAAAGATMMTSTMATGHETANGQTIEAARETANGETTNGTSPQPQSSLTSLSNFQHTFQQHSIANLRRRRYEKSINETQHTARHFQNALQNSVSQNHGAATHNDVMDETHLLGPGRLDGGWGLLYPKGLDGTSGERTATYYDVKSLGESAERIPPPCRTVVATANNANDATSNDNTADATSDPTSDPRGFASTRGGRTPSLFLQELAHLSSLLMAVALTTLRNDLDDVESPLDVYVPGQPWPEADPINLPKEVKRRAYTHGRCLRNLGYLLGVDQTKAARTIYNAARPMLVIGGVSDNEIAFLQRARGPYAKTQLAWSWLSDHIIREHLAGSLGNVGPPIVSRMIQFLSDGMIFYNHARKIMFIPFPFPHAQLSAFFVLVMVIAIPFLMDQYANEVWLGATLSFLTVTCLSGLHEVARELENPFRNAPNDVPLCTLLAFYNEALVCMYAGYHPDAYFNEAEVVKKRRKNEGGEGDMAGHEDGDGKDALKSAKSAESAESESPDLSDETEATTLVDDHSASHSASVTVEQLQGPPTPQNHVAVPQSIDRADSLKMLREMVESQANMIKDLQIRMKHREERLAQTKVETAVETSIGTEEAA